jgi:hypothetical protein
LLFALLLVPAGNAGAGLKDDVGWTALNARLGGGMPTGAGVPVLHVEASVTSLIKVFVAPAHDPFAPPPESISFPGSGVYTGKTFTLFSESSGQASWHAMAVAQPWYHVTDGLAPGVSEVDCLLADNFIARVNAGTLDDITTAPVQNHSYVFPDPAEESDNLFLRNYDRYLADHGIIAMVGLANPDTTAVAGIPPGLAPAYHVLSVGRSDGQHKTGTTDAALDGPGRMKPDLVSVSDYAWQATSWSTGAVSGAVTLLWQGLVDNHPGVTGAHRAMAARAIAIAGADKSKFPLWQRASTATPYDTTWGAGEVDVLRSWEILSGGQSGPGTISGHGWQSETPPHGTGTRTRAFTVPDGKFATFSCALAWNRTFNGPNPVLRDLGLVLRRTSAPSGNLDQSDSAVDNVEYIHRYHLPAGNYEFDVANLDATAHAIAWHLALTDGPALRCARVPGQGLQLAADNLDPYVTYTVEVSTTLANGSWLPHATLHLASEPVPAFSWSQSITADPERRFFRLRWSPP